MEDSETLNFELRTLNLEHEEGKAARIEEMTNDE